MARCNCGILPLIAVDPDSALTLTGTGTEGDPLILGNRPAPMGSVVYAIVGAATWDKATYPGAQWIRVRAVGGGGGSAGVTAGAGVGAARGGGAGGNYAEGWLDVDALPASVPITVGAGGLAGGAANGNGGNGAATSFGGLVVAAGGNGSLATPAPAAGVLVCNGGTPGGPNAGDFAVQGGPGDPGVQFSGTQRIAGRGGMAGGLGSHASSNPELGTGIAGLRFGGGASGPAAFAGSFAGSAGGGGIVIVEMFR